MIGRLLIDECLSPELAQLAIDAGHVESTCVRDRGRLGIKDWELMEYVIKEDFMLVTRNAQDFRGEGKPNPGGLHGAQGRRSLTDVDSVSQRLAMDGFAVVPGVVDDAKCDVLAHIFRRLSDLVRVRARCSGRPAAWSWRVI
jgi:hypothetical protein